MRKTINMQAENKWIARYRKGYPLLTAKTVETAKTLPEEGSLIQLFTKEGEFLGKGYSGRQNKGIGWILTHRQEEQIDQSFFSRALQKAIQKREAFLNNAETNAFRLFNGEGDGIGGLVIDYYAGFCVIQWYSAGIYSFKEEILTALQERLNPEGIYEKKRFDQKGSYMEDDDFVTGSRAPEPLIVKENGIHYAVYLDDGAMVGIFFDQRDVRNIIRTKYAKRAPRVLNTFSYTGAFSVAAARGGSHTTSVDLAKRSLSKTREQFEVNGMDADEHDIVVMDVFDYFKYAKRKNLVSDLVILDPPSFARSKKRTFSTAKDYPALLQDALAITKEGGYIVASTNNASFDMRKFKRFIDEGCKAAHAVYAIEEEFSLPGDFKVNPAYKEGDYLKVVMIQKKS